MLHDGRVDMALAGAVNRSDDLFIHVGFTALQALSRTGQSRPFHADADGLVPAEGAGFVALKRLADARQHGDTIYGVIRGIGLSNDGRGRGFLAPSEQGQRRAMEAAYASADLRPAEVSLLECHATGTSVGDATEIRSTAKLYADCVQVPVGSLKSNIGHLITAAGAAALIKVLEALRHGQRPPTLHAQSPNKALHQSPFRLLRTLEPWPCNGLRVAGISAFGFGGNNGHLLVSEHGTRAGIRCPGERDEAPAWQGERRAHTRRYVTDEQHRQAGWIGEPPRSGQVISERVHSPDIEALRASPAPPEPLAMVGIGAVVGEALDGRSLTRALLAGDSLVRTGAGGLPQVRTGAFELALSDLRFPPRDLEQALPQQLLVLKAAQEALAQTGSVLGSERAGVLVAMEPDPEVCRYGLRWRLAQQLGDSGRSPSDHQAWLERKKGQIIPALSSASVVGTMPNIPANRLNSQFDLGGASLSLSAGEGSGLIALALARRALLERQLDVAVVCAVDLSCQEIHQRALSQIENNPGAPGDAAVALVLKRLADAEKDGDAIICVMEPAQESVSGEEDLREGELDSRLGRSWAAGGLRDLAATALALSHGADLTGQPLLTSAPASRTVTITQERFRLRPHPDTVPASTPSAGCLHRYAARDKTQLLAALEQGVESIHGPCRVVILARSAEQLDQRRALARRHIVEGTPPGPGVHYRQAPLGGELAFVFAGAGATYAGMGKALLQALPELGRSLVDSSPAAAEAFSKVLAADEAAADSFSVSQRLWASSALCQLHAHLTRHHLGLRPDAVIGYSSGESNALFASGTWTDLDAMMREGTASGIFTEQLGEQMDAVRRAWGAPVDWATWTVLAPVAEVQALVRQRAHVYISVIHTDTDCIVAGDAAGCDWVCQQIGRNRCLRLRYDLAVHVPELDQVREAWIALHRRAVTVNQAVRVYSSAAGAAYDPDPDSCANAILAQANRTLDFRSVIEAAWQDGVRTFVEHGPQGSCSRWIRQILGDREALVISLDHKGAGLKPLLEATAALLAAGVPMDAGALLSRLAKSDKPPGPRARFEAHPAPMPELSFDELSQANPAMQAMAPAPRLDPVLSAHPLTPPSQPPTISTTPAATPDHPLLAALQDQIRELSNSLQAQLARQVDLYQQFASGQHRSMQVLGQASGEANGRAKTETPPLKDPAPLVDSAEPTMDESSPVSTSAPLIRPVGPTFDRAQLEIHAAGRISAIFGEQFAAQDSFHRQVRMPTPPLLLADRITGLAAAPGSMGQGTIWSETEVPATAWYLHQGHMPAGIMIEAGQADLMLISWMGVDFHNRAERVYRLLGCELTYHGGLPGVGDTLAYDIHLDGHATQGDVRLMFFHYDCRISGDVRLSVRRGQAGFFSDAELANSDGCLWSPEDQEVVAQPRLDPPRVSCTRREFSLAEVRALSDGRPMDCFGQGFELTQPHTRTPRIQSGQMLLLGAISDFDVRGGPWGRGTLKSVVQIDPRCWYFDGHFKNDPCMPGTLMFEGCLQAMAFYLTGLGYTIDRDGWRFEPVPAEPFVLNCRGQVTPASRELIYEIFVEEVHDGPVPTLHADLLCTVDGLKAFHARRVGLRLVPAWPLDQGSDELEGHQEPKPVAQAGGFSFDYRSLLACANGRPSQAFGPIYGRFDGPGRVARLPNPPYHFLSRVTRVVGDIGSMDHGMAVDVEYDIPPDAWYLDENGCRTMPFAVLLEAALQPCGWLASYMGCALCVEQELAFRNLDGTGRLLMELLPDAGTLLTRVRSVNTSRTGAMIIVSFEVECFVGEQRVYEMDTVFGFFPVEALENQVGLPTTETQRELLVAGADQGVDLTGLQGGDWAAHRPRLAEPMLLMLDRVTYFDPAGGEAGLGCLRAEKDVDPDEWFFKAHFFQDPVQPGSLGIEAMIQLLQWYMLQAEMDREIERPRFEPLALEQELTWKYRGQVVPTNGRITTTLEITEVVRQPRSALARGNASLWVDGKRIYEAHGLAMRMVSGGAGAEPSVTLDPKVDLWLNDHCPTWTVPALPMMYMVELLARGASRVEPLIALRDVRVARWLTFEAPRTLRAERRGAQVRLLLQEDAEETVIATAVAQCGSYPARPQPLPALSGDPLDLPYDNGQLFHGAAFQVLNSLVRTAQGASSMLRAASDVPLGRLNPALLDGATHGIPHDELQLWDSRLAPHKVAYPALISQMLFYGPTPSEGLMRCEVRPDGLLGSADLPAFSVQLIGPDGVWCAFRLVERCFPKGSLGAAEPRLRRAFLRDRQYVQGLTLSRRAEGTTRLTEADVAEIDWLPGTVEAIYGSRDVETIARKEHLAAAHLLHPSILPAAIPLTRANLSVERDEEGVVVRGDGAGTLDLTAVREFWGGWFNSGHGPVEDIYYGLTRRFVRRVVLTDPYAFDLLRGRGIIFLANHQVGIESLLFSIIASALGRLPTITLAKDEHRQTWIGRLIAHCFAYPGITDPGMIRFFNRKERASLPRILAELEVKLRSSERSLMVHVEGTRSLDCSSQVRTVSSTVLDLALSAQAPIVPVRLVGGLPREPLPERLEFPVGMGRQDFYLGAPIFPEQLAELSYAHRRTCVLAAINALGPGHELEQPLPGDPAFEARVEAWQHQRCESLEGAVLGCTLSELPAPAAGIARLLAAESAAELRGDPEGEWLAALRQGLLSHPGVRNPRE